MRGSIIRMYFRIPLYIIFLTFFSCSPSENLYQDLPIECNECVFVPERFENNDGGGCGYKDYKENLNAEFVIRNLKKLDWHVIHEADWGATPYVDFYITKGEKFILSESFWFYKGNVVIYHHATKNYYSCGCDEFDFMFE